MSGAAPGLSDEQELGVFARTPASVAEDCTVRLERSRTSTMRKVSATWQEGGTRRGGSLIVCKARAPRLHCV